jgi:hypothetical protein
LCFINIYQCIYHYFLKEDLWWSLCVWFSSALRDVRIPPGPRLLILDHLRRSGSYSKHDTLLLLVIEFYLISEYVVSRDPELREKTCKPWSIMFLFIKKKDLAMRDHFVFDTAEVRGSSFWVFNKISSLLWTILQCQLLFYSVRNFDIMLKLFKFW